MLKTILFNSSVFSSIAVLMNSLLMMLWFPASVIIKEQFPSKCGLIRSCIFACSQKWCSLQCGGSQWTFSLIHQTTCVQIEKFFSSVQIIVIDIILRFRYLWFTILTGIAFAGAVVVFYYPKLQLPDTADFQLFDKSHVFEQYDLLYKHLFWFTKMQNVSRLL